jgi:adenine-specific DNA-methyltransferase
MAEKTKELGQFFTPPSVAQTLVKWVVRQPTDLLLDPSCGNGEFLVHHTPSVGIELSAEVCQEARARAPQSQVIESEFFIWASYTSQRFDAAAGNPPFIRYQTFNGDRRSLALQLARLQGADFSGLTSSWAPFLVIASSLLKPGGRIGFVVPAEIGHSTYSAPLIEFLAAKFAFVQFIAIKEKIFPKLSEDAWLLFADGYGGTTREIAFSRRAHFSSTLTPPHPNKLISIAAWRQRGSRLRKFLLPADVLAYYDGLSAQEGVVTLGDIARTGIGYVTGDNSFFHLRPSEAKRLGIPARFLRVAVRKGEQLNDGRVDQATVRRWIQEDKQVLLLDLSRAKEIPSAVQMYLDSRQGQEVRDCYKCRNRHPWYVIPDISVPDAFLTYMHGAEPALIPNEAGCVCTNSLLAIRLTNGIDRDAVVAAWHHPLSRLSQEIEGHPLGGGMLKLEPGEAARVRLPITDMPNLKAELLKHGIAIMREWRHHKSHG